MTVPDVVAWVPASGGPTATRAPVSAHDLVSGRGTALYWRREDGEDAVFVCPAPKGQGPITREAVEKFYRRTLELTGKHSPHSWRSVFSTWGRDAGKDADAVEAQLDHMIGTKQAAAYDRAKRLDIRRALMTWHERQLLAARDGANIVPLRKATPST